MTTNLRIHRSLMYIIWTKFNIFLFHFGNLKSTDFRTHKYMIMKINEKQDPQILSQYTKDMTCEIILYSTLAMLLYNSAGPTNKYKSLYSAGPTNKYKSLYSTGPTNKDKSLYSAGPTNKDKSLYSVGPTNKDKSLYLTQAQVHFLILYCRVLMWFLVSNSF